MDIEIRLMNYDDYKQALALYESSFNIKQKNNYKIEDTNAYFIVAESDNQIIGLMQIDIICDVFKGIKYGFFNSVCVSTDYRRKGIGDKMIDYACQFCMNNDCDYIELTSSNKKVAAHKLYFKHNFEIRETNVFKKKL